MDVYVYIYEYIWMLARGKMINSKKYDYER